MTDFRGRGRHLGRGAHNRTRTDDLFLTKEVLCQLSYVGPGPIARVIWWAGRELNPHSRRRLVYSQRSSPPAQPTHCGSGTESRTAVSWCDPPPDRFRSGADDGTRTRNLLFTKQLLYQLSYVGATRRDIPQLTPPAPGNDRSVRADGSSVGGAGASAASWVSRAPGSAGRPAGGRRRTGRTRRRTRLPRRPGSLPARLGSAWVAPAVGAGSTSAGLGSASAGDSATSADSSALRRLRASDQWTRSGERPASGPPASRWATASNRSTDPATAALSDPIAPRMGIRMNRSQRRRMAGPRPWPSLPTTIASGPRRSVWRAVSGASASGSDDPQAVRAEVGERAGQVVDRAQQQVFGGARRGLDRGRRQRRLAPGREDHAVDAGRLGAAEQRAEVLRILERVEDEHERRLAALRGAGEDVVERREPSRLDDQGDALVTVEAGDRRQRCRLRPRRSGCAAGSRAGRAARAPSGAAGRRGVDGPSGRRRRPLRPAGGRRRAPRPVRAGPGRAATTPDAATDPASGSGPRPGSRAPVVPAVRADGSGPSRRPRSGGGPLRIGGRHGPRSGRRAATVGWRSAPRRWAPRAAVGRRAAPRRRAPRAAVGRRPAARRWAPRAAVGRRAVRTRPGVGGRSAVAGARPRPGGRPAGTARTVERASVRAAGTAPRRPGGAPLDRPGALGHRGRPGCAAPSGQTMAAVGRAASVRQARPARPCRAAGCPACRAVACPAPFALARRRSCRPVVLGIRAVSHDRPRPCAASAGRRACPRP